MTRPYTPEPPRPAGPPKVPTETGHVPMAGFNAAHAAQEALRTSEAQAARAGQQAQDELVRYLAANAEDYGTAALAARAEAGPTARAAALAARDAKRSAAWDAQVPDSEAIYGAPPLVMPTPLRDGPKYGAVTVLMPSSTGRQSVAVRISREQARQLAHALMDHLAGLPE